MKKRLIVVVLSLIMLLSITVTSYGDDSEMSTLFGTTVTKNEAVNWAKNRINKSAKDVDGAYGPQCVDFIMEYYQFLGVPLSGGNACDYATNTLPSGFIKNKGLCRIYT